MRIGLQKFTKTAFWSLKDEVHCKSTGCNVFAMKLHDFAVFFQSFSVFLQSFCSPFAIVSVFIRSGYFGAPRWDRGHDIFNAKTQSRKGAKLF